MKHLECLSLDPEETFEGAKIQFTGEGGYESERNHAKTILKVDGIYTVAYLEVGSWSSYVELVEFPGKHFNTVMFINWE